MARRIRFLLLVAILALSPIMATAAGAAGAKSIILQIGNKTATVDGESVTLDAPPAIMDGRTMVPLRFIAEALGLPVEWDGATQTVRIGNATIPTAPAPAPVSYTLDMEITAFIGAAGDINGVRNPVLKAQVGQPVSVTLVNIDDMEHDFVIKELGVQSDSVFKEGEKTVVTFIPDKPGTFNYYCSIPGHRRAGMEGTIEVTGSAAAAPETPKGSETTTPAPVIEPARANAKSVVKDPTDIPGPITRREPQTITVDMETVEVDGQLADGTTFTYWTFNGTVPGPMVRARVGDTIIMNLKNADDSKHVHSIDFHSVTGPGGGAKVTQVKAGETKSFSWKAMNPGVYIYHCASPYVPAHIANGMYGIAVIEPEEGLEPVDREFYVVQGELYTDLRPGQKGHAKYDDEAQWNEEPNFVVFNGAVNALTGDRAMQAKVGDKVRIFIGNGGTNLISNFHVIGEIFDKVYKEGASEALTNIQTTLVPAGGAAIVEFTIDVPGDYLLVDHALNRVFGKGALAVIHAEGEENPEVFEALESANAPAQQSLAATYSTSNPKWVAKDPTEIPGPITRREPQTITVDMETVEVVGQLDDGTTFEYWTFDGTVPGPMVRARVGDTIVMNLKNADDSKHIHSIDFHSVTGPGGGAKVTQVKAGETKSFRWKAMNPGVYIYHCASPYVPAHIANGMYGIAVIEPEEGLEPVDREFYVVQGELYTDLRPGQKGHAKYDDEAQWNEEPNFVVFNGAVRALTGERAMKAKVGEKVRIFIGNGGTNLISNFHVIGEIFDKVYPEGASEYQTNIQTTLIPAGGAAIVEFTLDVPGDYLLVDHALNRVFGKGALAIITAEGEENHDIFHAITGETPGSGH